MPDFNNKTTKIFLKYRFALVPIFIILLFLIEVAPLDCATATKEITVIKANEQRITAMEAELEGLNEEDSPEYQDLLTQLNILVQHQNRLLRDQKLNGDKNAAANVLANNGAPVAEFPAAGAPNSVAPTVLTKNIDSAKAKINEEPRMWTTEQLRALIKAELLVLNNGHSEATLSPNKLQTITKTNPAKANTQIREEATVSAQQTAPELPESNSLAIAQYEQSLKLFDAHQYKLAAANFGRLIKAYPKDPLANKALVYFGLCLVELKQLDKAAIVCKKALNKPLSDSLKAKCSAVLLKQSSQTKN